MALVFKNAGGASGDWGQGHIKQQRFPNSYNILRNGKKIGFLVGEPTGYMQRRSRKPRWDICNAGGQIITSAYGFANAKKKARHIFG